jgi:hypothetical protein
MNSIKRAKIWGGITAVVIMIGLFFILKQIPFQGKTFDNLSFPTAPGASAVVDTVKETKFYKHPSGFSFNYPAGFSLNLLPDEDGGEVILVQNQDRTLGFQIFSLPFDEKGPLTQERIQRDVPDIVMAQVAPISISGNDSGITFVSNDTGIENREVWFIYEGRLYQILTSVNTQNLLEEVLNTWRF